MPDYQRRDFSYATSKQEDEWLYLQINRMKGHYVGTGYAFVDELGTLTNFHEMIALSGADGHTGDTLIVSSKDFFSRFSLEDLKVIVGELARIEMKVLPVDDKLFRMESFVEGFQLATSKLPEHYRSQEAHTAVALCRLGHGLDEVCEVTGLDRATVLRAMAAYEEEQAVKRSAVEVCEEIIETEAEE